MTDQTYQVVDAAIVLRFAGPTKFVRLPSVSSAAGLDNALVGIPWDGGTTNRAGARAKFAVSQVLCDACILIHDPSVSR